MIAFVALGFVGTTMAATPDLLQATTYGVLAGTYTNPAITSTINWDVGFTTAPANNPWPFPSVLRHPSVTYPNYGDTANDTPQARLDATSALAILNAQGPCISISLTNLSTDTDHGTMGVYGPGVYCTAGAVTAANITLSGAGTYIFRINGALNTTVTDSITLTNGASVCDVFWTPNGITTLAANTNFLGTIIANTNAITLNNMVIWTGRALTLGAGTVTTNSNDTITVPTCTATLNVIKTVDTTSGGTTAISWFILTVNSGLVFYASGVGSTGTLYTWLSAGNYSVLENIYPRYTSSFTGDCSSTGSILLYEGYNKTCTVINTYFPPATLHVIKTVVGWGGLVASNFILTVNSGGVFYASGLGSTGTLYTLLSAGVYTVDEPLNASYTKTFSGACNWDSGVMLAMGDNKTCEIINTYITPIIPPSGGGGWSSVSRDVCLNWDYSPSFYDEICGTAPIVTMGTVVVTKTITTGSIVTHVFVPGLPKTWLFVQEHKTPWNVIAFASILLVLSTSFIVVLRKRKI